MFFFITTVIRININKLLIQRMWETNSTELFFDLAAFKLTTTANKIIESNNRQGGSIAVLDSHEEGTNVQNFI